MINIFFEINTAHIDKGNRIRLYDDNDILALTELQNAFKIYEDDKKAIIQWRADNLTIQELAYQSNCFNPLSQEAVDALGINGKYVGNELEDVFKKYPELRGKRQIDTEDDVVEVNIIRRIG